MEVTKVLETYKDKLTQYQQNTRQNPKDKGFNNMIKERLKEYVKSVLRNEL